MLIKPKNFVSPRFRTLAGMVTLACSFACASMQAQSIHFDALPVKGGKKAVASCVMLDSKGTLATIVDLGADLKKATLITADGKKVSLVPFANDLNSRLVIYKQTGDTNALTGAAATLSSSLGLKPSQPIFTSPTDQADAARIVARVSRFEGKILPLAVLRVNHSKPAPRPGSGMYNDQGKLVGMVRQAVFGVKNSSYCLPVEVITRTMKDQELHGKIRRCWIGIVMDDLVAPPIVASVRPNSPAQKAGLQTGDVILSIGNQQVHGYSEVVDAFFYLIAGEAKTFKILRGAKVKELSVTPEVTP